MMSAALLSVLLLGCAPESNPVNTQTGDPASVTVVPADADGLLHDGIELEVVAVAMETCDGSERTAEHDESLDLLAGDPLLLDPGEWCDGISIQIDDLIFEGTGEATGSAYLIKLTFPEIRLLIEDTITLDGQDLVLELGVDGWTDEESLELAEGDVSIGAVHWMHDALADVIARQSVLYEDLDASGNHSDWLDTTVAAGIDRE